MWMYYCSELKAVTDDGKMTALLVKEKKDSSEECQYVEVYSILALYVFNQISYSHRCGMTSAVRRLLT